MTIVLTRGSASDIAALEPLWVSVHHRHVESMPELAPYVDDATTWAERRALYTELLAKPDSVLLLAHDDRALVAYGLAHVMPVAETWLADTWETGERIGEIESLGVLPSHRNQGIGSALLHALEAQLAECGVIDLIVGALAGNEAAIRLYESRGYRPTWLYMSRRGGGSARIRAVTSSTRATGITGLTASPPGELSFSSALQIHAFRLHRPQGDLQVYAAGGWGTDPVAQQQFLGHWHEAAEGGPATGAPVHVHAADADEVRSRLAVAATFAEPFSVDDDFEALPMPGHTPGSTAYLWRTGEERVLFTADTIYPRDDGVWRAAVLPTSDRDAMADSLERLAAVEFTVLAPWVTPAEAAPVLRVAPADGRERLLAAAARVRAGEN